MSTNISKININACESVQYEIDNWAIIRGLSSKEHGKLYLCEDINNVFEEPAHATHSGESNGNVLFFYDEQTVRKMLMDSGKEEFMDYLDIEEDVKPAALTPVRHEEVEVCGATVLAAVTEDGKAYFSPRHLCEALGIAWPRQFTKIKSDPVLGSSVTEMVTEVNRADTGNKTTRKTTMLPIEFASGWLFTIKKVRPEVQHKLNMFRAEAFHVLDLWFRQGFKKNKMVQAALDLPDFNDPVAAARAWADQVEKRQALEAKNKKLAPKAKVYDATFAKKLSPLQVVVRKLRGVNTMKIKSDLLDAGYLYKRGGVYRVYSQYRDKAFVEKFDPRYNRTEIYALDKGKQKIVELYRAGRLSMKNGCENAYRNFKG
ncbi:phage antirepressor N-terminal domain-containing protein [Maridesulfovibrio sp.]|uniref:phage antirepressor N-terminal domain-containing protein n=1 Tax=Maridesulfovibrio sp. TaxID=2795000 RepID=UPI0029CAAAA4|nr:phage antirepressor N-terminal domain-containing protein [Maridesulfovibrio sp.]